MTLWQTLINKDKEIGNKIDEIMVAIEERREQLLKSVSCKNDFLPMGQFYLATDSEVNQISQLKSMLSTSIELKCAARENIKDRIKNRRKRVVL